MLSDGWVTQFPNFGTSISKSIIISAMHIVQVPLADWSLNCGE